MSLIEDIRRMVDALPDPFHFVASSDTVRVLEQRTNKVAVRTPEYRLAAINALGGVRIFIDEAVAFGHIEKRSGAMPKKESDPAVSAPEKYELGSEP